jgi:predicted amidohydrolase YtcJ
MSTRTAADLAIISASVRTLDPERPEATAVAFRDGTVVAVGSDAEVREVCDGATELVDGSRMSIVPGIVDGHIHPFWPEMVVGADLTRCASLAELHRELAAERERVGPGGWVRGWGIDYGIFRETGIDGELLEPAVGGAPALVKFMDGHTGLATPRALELAGISGPVTFAEGSEVVVRDGRPTGELREGAAIGLVGGIIPALTDAELRAIVLRTQAALNSLGVTGVHAMNGGPETFDLMRELEASGDLKLRAIIPFWQRPERSFEEMEEQLSLRDRRGRLWRGGVAKFFIDGVIDTGTGWLYDPDTLGGGTEPFWPDPDRYARAVAMFAGAGFQCATHATGDRGVRAALDAYKAAGAAPGVRHRIEHIETLPDHDLPRFHAEGVAASMQPLHMQWRRGDHEDSWAKRLGPERAARAWRTRDLLDSGALLPLGSDWAVASYDPRSGMAWARLRRTPGRPDAPVFEPDQRLTGLEVLNGYTVANATVVGEENVAGRIKQGFRADVSAFADDPVTCDPDELIELPIRLTVVDGRIAYRGER